MNDIRDSFAEPYENFCDRCNAPIDMEKDEGVVCDVGQGETLIFCTECFKETGEG